VIIDDLLVDRHHASVRQSGDGWELRDLGSASGTFVEGRRIDAVVLLQPGHSFVVGRTQVRVEADGLSVLEQVRSLALEADDLVVTIPSGERILNGVNLALEPGKLLAVVGPTGSGKSTLLKALTGFRPPDGGEVLFMGRNLYKAFDELRRQIGYVPQDDILHPQLTIKAALEFGAELRFPADVTKHERSERVTEVMSELGLSHRADVPIEKLSGGQRKRVSVALELLTKPSLLFLDEPTSGLDPGFEKQVMQLLRDLANSGRTVVVVTHSLQSLDLCDQVLFLAPGGSTAFYGPPSEALRYFGRDDFADVFQDLEADRDGDWKGRFEARSGGTKRRSRRTPDLVGPAAANPPPPVPWASQLSTLVRRQIAVIAADKRNLGYLAAEMLIPAVLILLLVSSGSLDPNSENARQGARTLIGALVISAAVVGSANAIREIVKETALYQRERSIGLYRSAYLTSKFGVLGVLTAVQVAVIVLFGVARASGPNEAILFLPPIAELVGNVVLAGVSAVALGLLISALVATSEKAMALVPVIFITMWLFSGITLDLPAKPVMRELGYLTSSSWGVTSAASSVDVVGIEGNCRGAASSTRSGSTSSAVLGGRAGATVKPPACDERWQHDGFHWAFAVFMQLALTAGALGLASLALRKKEPIAGMNPPVDWRTLPDRSLAALTQLIEQLSGQPPPPPMPPMPPPTSWPR
jgi:ABC-type multidrug transport system ATPase subunit